MNEIELRKAVIFIMWLRQAQPPGFVLCLQTYGLSSATGDSTSWLRQAGFDKLSHRGGIIFFAPTLKGGKLL